MTLAAEEWRARCGVKKLAQDDTYGCGVACLAMVLGCEYSRARTQFIKLGLGVRRSSRPALSTTSREMHMAISSAGLITEARRWRGWENFQGLGILKVRDDWRGAKGRWHWVVAFRHPVYELAIFDPHMLEPSFKRAPSNLDVVPFSIYEPKGEWFQVEQRIDLVTNPYSI